MPGFVDEAQIHVKAGDGGAGAVSFRREAHVSRGGPDGGDGGKGGDVWLVASANQASLLGFRDHPHRRAGAGGHGQGGRRHGANGADLDVPVPVGTVVRRSRAEGGEVVADLGSAGDRALVARGGRGGRGNARFLTNRRRAPAFAEQGETGEERWLDVELKLVADVAIVGFPNAGKSTLVSRISAARPKVADYPFTTLEPHLGVVRLGGAGDETELVVADVPGLVEGAAEGRGLGHRFLRHVERARVLLVLLDLVAADGRTAEEQERVLLDELRRYRPELLDRPRLVVGSKADAVGAAPGYPPRCISAVTGQGLDELLGALAALVVEARRAEAEEQSTSGIVVHRPIGETSVEVRREPDGSFLVGGRAALRAVSLSDLTDDEALGVVQERLRRLGVERALRRAGVHEGDVVHLGPLTFTFHREETALEVQGAEEPVRRRGR
ncbi:MAG: GTPase ObgE [Acidobacteriota bacterium]|nr:GTPase ObgE [Acidobacteriota bacterium]